MRIVDDYEVFKGLPAAMGQKTLTLKLAAFAVGAVREELTDAEAEWLDRWLVRMFGAVPEHFMAVALNLPKSLVKQTIAEATVKLYNGVMKAGITPRDWERGSASKNFLDILNSAR